MKILLHDRSFQISSQLERNIKSIDSSISVSKVNETETAIDSAKSSDYKMMITDGNSLEGKFKELTSAFKNSNPDSYLIVLIAFGNSRLKEKFIDNGADYCFDRICEFDTFMDFIKSVNREVKDLEKLQRAV